MACGDGDGEMAYGDSSITVAITVVIAKSRLTVQGRRGGGRDCGWRLPIAAFRQDDGGRRGNLGMADPTGRSSIRCGDA